MKAYADPAPPAAAARSTRRRRARRSERRTARPNRQSTFAGDPVPPDSRAAAQMSPRSFDAPTNGRP